MKPSELSQRLEKGLLDFLWDEWAQMGVLASPRRNSPWSEDPEALILLTLEVGRADPRLFDEVLDWLVVNDSLLSVRRLRNMCHGVEDRRLLDAVLGWLAQTRSGGGHQRDVARTAAADLEPLFRDLSAPADKRDPAFAAAGLLRSPASLSSNSRKPNLTAPINFAFRLRQLLGTGARAEAVRFLLTVEAPSATAQAVTASAGFARRNVHEALTALKSAGVVTLWTAGSRQSYTIDRDAWAQLLSIDPAELPAHRDWPQLSSGLRRILRWLRRSDLDELSGYLLGGVTRDLLEEVRGDFEHAGLHVRRSLGADAWLDLEALIDQALN